MKSQTNANRKLWDTWTKLHVESEFYDLQAFERGGTTLTKVELEEVGPIKGKSLLHLQSHFGLDTLSWARLGANVTGIDFSPEAVAKARELSGNLKIPARFFVADVENPATDLKEDFDVVFTSYGVLSWLNDLSSWATVIARHLKPGGFFYMVELHPVLGMLDDDGKHFKYPYFERQAPIVSEETVSYAGGAHSAMVCYQWSHSISEIMSVLINAGLRIEYLHEFPYCTQPCYPFLIESEPGRYVARYYPDLLPLMFSIKATWQCNPK
jgi:SAM-dependent methyltransferase